MAQHATPFHDARTDAYAAQPPPGGESPAPPPRPETNRQAYRCTVCGESLVDAVTGALYRHTWDRRAAATVADARRERRSLALILADVDRFKAINDTYGHPAGDKMLHAIAEVLRSGSGDTGIVGRYGGCAGDEFLILLPGLDLNHTLALARRMRDQVRRLVLRVLTERGVFATLAGQTVSMGVAVATDLPPGALADLLLDCDTALRQAKQNGGDQVRVALPHPGIPAKDASRQPWMSRDAGISHDMGIRLMLAPHHCLPRAAERELALSPLGVEHVYTVLSTLLNRCTAPLDTL
ncbi:GGDEF domain-containing protein [Streptomyces fractus]|uniref:GGDEF domain-containing protein n=1 Tax=Streptomyces fractus TaxID=641806 RepID=UPI003CFAF55D